MKVRVVVTLVIDPDVWMLAYGVERSEIRKDVQEWASNALTEHARDLGHLVDVGR